MRDPNMSVLFAQQQVTPASWWEQYWPLIVGGLLLLVGIFFLIVFFSFVRLWIQCLLTGARISILDLIGMKLRNVDYAMIVRQKIALVQAGVKVSTGDLEAHYLSRGNVPKTGTAVIAAHKASIDLPWKIAAAIDLAGRDVLDAVKTSVNPKVIDCPDPSKGRPTLDGVCKAGIHLKARPAAAVAREQEMKAAVEENRAKVVLAEAEIPQAIAQAFRDGHLGVGDYYNLRNVQADTQMRNAVAEASSVRTERGINNDLR